MSKQSLDIKPAKGKLGVMLVGLGAVSTTFIAGVELIRKGLAKPLGSQAWMGTARLGKRTENRTVKISELVPLARPEDLVFAAWDIFPDNAYEAAAKAGVLVKEDLDKVKDELLAIRPIKGAFDPEYVKRLSGTHVKTGTRRQLAEALRADIREFAKTVDRVVVVWAASTEIYTTPGAPHASMAAFEKALDANERSIAPSQLYAYAALSEGVPFANGAPNLCVDTDAMVELAKRNGVPICGKDFKTGQTLMKTIVAPGLKARLLGVAGWFSTNILGNRDGEVLDDPESFKSKEVSKAGVLDTILQPSVYPDLYSNLYHKIRINYYPPRGDAKEGWDNIDIFGWLGYPMQIKIDFLCRDSILAAPIVLDLALFSDLAKRAGYKGIQEWLSFFFKSPQAARGLYPEHDLFIQHIKFKNTLRHMAGEELITHLGLDYYHD
ncbi:MAG: inositol-3-phosphate synthase [Deltaproteobacteria bacterium]|nr:inositol-3-phosphate synthase [Deltaproteobacteria bacterium]